MTSEKPFFMKTDVMTRFWKNCLAWKVVLSIVSEISFWITINVNFWKLWKMNAIVEIECVSNILAKIWYYFDIMKVSSVLDWKFKLFITKTRDFFKSMISVVKLSRPHMIYFWALPKLLLLCKTRALKLDPVAKYTYTKLGLWLRSALGDAQFKK